MSTAPGVVADGPTTICYAWVSGPGQEVELDRQEALMAAYCIGQGWSTRVVLDYGAGPELRELVELVLYRQVDRRVVIEPLPDGVMAEPARGCRRDVAAISAGLTVLVSLLALGPRLAFSSRPASQGGSLLALGRRSCSTAGPVARV